MEKRERKPVRTSKMEPSAKVVNDFSLSTLLTKKSVQDV